MLQWKHKVIPNRKKKQSLLFSLFLTLLLRGWGSFYTATQINYDLFFHPCKNKVIHKSPCTVVALVDLGLGNIRVALDNFLIMCVWEGGLSMLNCE